MLPRCHATFNPVSQFIERSPTVPTHRHTRPRPNLSLPSGRPPTSHLQQTTFCLAWTDLLSLPKLVNGRANSAASVPPTTCEGSVNSVWKLLEEPPWQKQRTPSRRKRKPDDSPCGPHDDEDDFQKRDVRATALVKQDQLSKACTALLDEPPVACSETAAKVMRDRHPPPRAEHVARMKLLPVPQSPSPCSHRSLCCRKICCPSRQTPQRNRRRFARSTSRHPGVQGRSGASSPRRGRHCGRGPHPGHHRFLDLQCLAHGIEEHAQSQPGKL